MQRNYYTGMERESFSRAKVIGTITGFCSSAFSRVQPSVQEQEKNEKINK